MPELNDELEITTDLDPTDCEAKNSDLENSADEVADEVAEFSENAENAEIPDEIVGDFLSLNEIKSFCRIIGDAENEMLKALILSAKSFFESYTQRQMSDFKGEIPDEIKQWGRVKVATWYDLRTDFIAGISIAKAENSFIDCVLDRWRKSPLRLLDNENEILKAKISAQNEQILAMAQQILELKAPKEPTEQDQPTQPQTGETQEPSDEITLNFDENLAYFGTAKTKDLGFDELKTLSSQSEFSNFDFNNENDEYFIICVSKNKEFSGDFMLGAFACAFNETSSDLLPNWRIFISENELPSSQITLN